MSKVQFLLLFSCEKESNQEVITEVITNPIALDILTKKDLIVKPYHWEKNELASKTTQVSFEKEYGTPKNSSLTVVDIAKTTTLIPLVDTNNNLKSWLVGYYNAEGEIVYRVQKIDTSKETAHNLNSNKLTVKVVGETRLKKRAKSIASANKGSWVCGDEYFYGCVELATSNGDSETTCKWFYKGEKCVYQEEQTEIDWLDDSTEDDWQNPFGGGPSPNCPPGYTKDDEGNCIASPCARIKQQNIKTNFKAKIKILKDSTGLRKETGYLQNINGSFSKLTASTNGHSLEIDVDNNTNIIGYLHTHLNDWETGKIVEGRPEEERPVKIFSPADVIVFLKILKNISISDTPLTDAYGTMVSSSGTYTIRYTGNTNTLYNIKTNYTKAEKMKLTNDFKEISRNVSNERLFLNYIKDSMGVSGVNLYKVQNNGKIIPKILGSNGKVYKGDCDE
ncbi:MAG: hypothetical protein ACSHWV_05415 [Cellulophaga fucicola]